MKMTYDVCHLRDLAAWNKNDFLGQDAAMETRHSDEDLASWMMTFQSLSSAEKQP